MSPPAGRRERTLAVAAAVGCMLQAALWAVVGAATVFLAWLFVPIGGLWLVAGVAIYDGSRRAAAFATSGGLVLAILMSRSLLSWRDLESWQHVEPVFVVIQLAALVLAVSTAVLAAPQARPAFRRAWRALCGDL